MSDKDNGGAAFPKAGLDPWGAAKSLNTGMTLRDYFAAKASEEDIEYQIRMIAPRNGFGEVMSHKVGRAAARFAHADEMIQERAK